jgi:hypothetical protein
MLGLLFLSSFLGYLFRTTAFRPVGDLVGQMVLSLELVKVKNFRPKAVGKPVIEYPVDEAAPPF